MKISYLWIVGFCMLFSGLAQAEPKNVLFLISDDLSSQSLGCYGNQQCQTPNLDSLAQDGLRFEQIYCQYPVCGPSRAALMSGMYAQAIGVTSNGASDKFTGNLADRPSMSQHFKDHGYYAARVSKIYHMRVPGDITAGVDGPDHAASWTERFNCQAPEQWSVGQAEHLTNEKLKPDPKRSIHYNLGYGGAFYAVRVPKQGVEQADVKAADKAIQLLQDRAQDGKKFFLAVGLVRPHVPLVAPESDFERYVPSEMELPKQVEGDWDDIPRAGISKNSQGIGLRSLSKKQKVLQAYYACVSFMDAQVGRILEELKRLELDKNTIVVFTADHGYHLGEHDFWQKMSLHEESTHIPLIIRAPGEKPRVISALGQQIDIYPTLAQLCGLSLPDHLQGKSLVPAINGETDKIHEEVYCLRNRADHLLRTQRWAFIQYGKGGQELYDMQNDPHQFNNLAADEAHSQVLNSMSQKLNAKLRAMQAE